jgi:hypothetical protein
LSSLRAFALTPVYDAKSIPSEQACLLVMARMQISWGKAHHNPWTRQATT